MVVEVKQVAVFVLHGNGYAIHIIVAAFRVAQNMRLYCLVGEPFQRCMTAEL